MLQKAKNIIRIERQTQVFKQLFCSEPKNNSTKINLKIIENELKNNPEFDQAYPQFANLKPKSTLNKQEQNLDFVDSLGLKTRVTKTQSIEEQQYENYETFLEGYKSPSGPIKWMSEEEKNKIHILIDEKLEQLEQSQLSREEILYDDGRKGIPLQQDPFYQFIKNNKSAREMFLKPGSEFTVKKVVEIALRQDIGPDPSQATNLQNLPQTSKLQDDTNIRDEGNWNTFKPEQYFSQYSSKTQSYLNEFLKPDHKVFHMPMSDAQKRKKNQRKINYFDIHWRNTELLSQFLNSAANIKSQKQNRLTQKQQKKIAKAIKVAREMALLPYIGTIKPSDRQSLKTLQEDLDQRTKMAINIQTGHIYVKGQEPTSEEIHESIQNKIGHEDPDYELTIQELAPEENTDALIQAQAQAKINKEKSLLQQGIDPEALKKIENNPVNTTSLTPDQRSSIYPQNNNILEDTDPVSITLREKVPEEILQKSYQKIEEQINKQNITNFTKLLISEKAFEISNFETPIEQNENVEDISVEEGLKILNQVRELGNLTPIQTI